MVVAPSDCSRMRVERRSNRSRSVTVAWFKSSVVSRRASLLTTSACFVVQESFRGRATAGPLEPLPASAWRTSASGKAARRRPIQPGWKFTRAAAAATTRLSDGGLPVPGRWLGPRGGADRQPGPRPGALGSVVPVRISRRINHGLARSLRRSRRRVHVTNLRADWTGDGLRGRFVLGKRRFEILIHN